MTSWLSTAPTEITEGSLMSAGPMSTRSRSVAKEHTVRIRKQGRSEETNAVAAHFPAKHSTVAYPQKSEAHKLHWKYKSIS
jgi:hypothetical protein